MAYTAIALQELVLYNNYPSIYWNTATLTVNSGSLEEGRVDESLKEKTKATDYGRVASAIGDLQHRGVEVTLPLINQASYDFTPDEENNRIIFALRSILGIGTDIADTIINQRPFNSFKHFYEVVDNIDEDNENNVKITNSKIITLIKAGCFDELESDKTRVELMREYLELVNKPKTNLNMQNWRAITKYEMVPDSLSTEERIVNFKNYVLRKSNLVSKSDKFKSKKIFVLKEDSDGLQSITDNFFQDYFMDVMEEDVSYWYDNNGYIEVYDTDLQRATKKLTGKLEDWLKTDEAVDLYNECMYQEIWDETCPGSISKWEMDSVCFYYHDHELEHMDMEYYGISDFNDLPREPEVVNQFKWRGRIMDEYAIHNIVGTVLDRDKTKHTVSLLTPTGVVTLKMYSGNFSHYDRQIAKTEPNGKKTIVERSWFTRGSLISVVGFRRGATFIPKKYRNSVQQHTIQKITDIDDRGRITLQPERRRVD